MKYAGLLTLSASTLFATCLALAPLPAHAQAQPAPIPPAVDPNAQTPGAATPPSIGAEISKWFTNPAGTPMVIVPYDELPSTAGVPVGDLAPSNTSWLWDLISGTDGKKYWLATPALRDGRLQMASTRVSLPAPQPPACYGVGCLNTVQQNELNTLCVKVGEEWNKYALCRDLSSIIRSDWLQ